MESLELFELWCGFLPFVIQISGLLFPFANRNKKYVRFLIFVSLCRKPLKVRRADIFSAPIAVILSKESNHKFKESRFKAVAELPNLSTSKRFNMPKTPSEKLFRLVKSLSGSEKRYFKIYINNKGGKDNKYLQLFEAIEAQDLFNEEKLQRTVYPGGATESRKYSELKGYLYDLVLRSLQAYDEKSSVDYKLKNMLLSVRTLYKRSLFDDCKELLHKAKKTAAKYEDFNAALEILQWEKQIAYAETDIAYLDKNLSRIAEAERHIVRQIRNFSEYKNLFYRLLTEVRKDATYDKNKAESLAFVQAAKVMSSVEKANSHRSRVLYYRILSVYWFAVRNLEKFYAESSDLLTLMESKKYMIAEDTAEYISALSNHLVAAGSLEKFDEVEQNLNKLKAIRSNTIDDELKSYRQYYLGKFTLYITSGKFTEAYFELQQHLKSRNKYSDDLFNKDAFYYLYFTICFGAERYEEALTHLNEWLGMSRNVERKDLQGLAKILNLIIHYEMQNSELLESLLRSASRYLNEQKMMAKAEKKILTALRRAVDTVGQKALRIHWQEVSEEYAQLSQEETQSITRWFPIQEWIDAQASESSFAEMVRHRFEDTIRKKH